MKKIFLVIMSLLICSNILCACSDTSSASSETSQQVTTKNRVENENTSNFLVTAEEVNVREAPNTDSKVLTSYYKNTIVPVIKTDNTNDEFYKVKLDDDYGYIYSEYITAVDNETSKEYEDYQLKNTEKLYAVLNVEYGNIRTLPSTESDIWAIYQKNDTLEIFGATQNDWYLLNENDNIVYVSPEIVTIISKEDYDGYNKSPEKKEFKKENLLGEYSTYYSPYEENRTYNLEKATDSLNNMIISPKATFNWCRDMGPCGKDEGYRESIEIVNNEYVTGYGGGICQVSSTLCAAVISTDSEIEFLDRSSHAIPQDYIPRDMDATVSYPSCNFVFRNNNPYSIGISTSHDGGTLTIRIYKI